MEGLYLYIAFSFLFSSIIAAQAIDSKKFYKNKGSIDSCTLESINARSNLHCCIQCSKVENCKAFEIKNKICGLASCVGIGDREIYSVFVTPKRYFFTSNRSYTIVEAASECNNTVQGAMVAEPETWLEYAHLKSMVRNVSYCGSDRLTGKGRPAFYIGLKNPNGTDVVRSDDGPLKFDLVEGEFWLENQPDYDEQFVMAMECPKTLDPNEGLALDIDDLETHRTTRAICQIPI